MTEEGLEFRRLWAELPPLYGVICWAHNGQWAVAIGSGQIVAGFPLTEVLREALRLHDANPTPQKWPTQEDYRRAWDALKREKPAEPEAVKRVVIRIVPQFTAQPKGAKPKPVKESWSLF